MYIYKIYTNFTLYEKAEIQLTLKFCLEICEWMFFVSWAPRDCDFSSLPWDSLRMLGNHFLKVVNIFIGSHHQNRELDKTKVAVGTYNVLPFNY